MAFVFREVFPPGMPEGKRFEKNHDSHGEQNDERSVYTVSRGES
jgi:hypothetical protein